MRPAVLGRQVAGRPDVARHSVLMLRVLQASACSFACCFIYWFPAVFHLVPALQIFSKDFCERHWHETIK